MTELLGTVGTPKWFRLQTGAFGGHWKKNKLDIWLNFRFIIICVLTYLVVAGWQPSPLREEEVDVAETVKPEFLRRGTQGTRGAGARAWNRGGRGPAWPKGRRGVAAWRGPGGPAAPGPGGRWRPA